MTNIYIIAGIISITFLVFKFLEMRYIEKESKPFKLLFRDTLIVYFSVLIAHFVIDQLNPIMVAGSVKQVTPVFTDNPAF